MGNFLSRSNKAEPQSSRTTPGDMADATLTTAASATLPAAIDAPAASTAAQQNCRLLRLPAEIRNHIFQLALVDRDSNASALGPSITGTCQDIRAETLPVFLGNTTFVFRSHNLGKKLALQWLSAIEGHSAEHKRLMTILISAEGQLLKRTAGPLSHLTTFSPNFDFWNALIVRIKQAGLTSTQLIWEGINTQVQGALPATPNAEDLEVISLRVVELYLLNLFVLPPLLKRHGLHDPTRPPVDIATEIQWNGTLYLMSKDGFQALTVRFAEGVPEKWYELWGSEEGKTAEL